MSIDDSQLSNTIDILCEKYGIQRDTIKYVKLNNGQQLIAELCDYDIVMPEDDVGLDSEISDLITMDFDDDMASIIMDDNYHIFFYPLEIVEESHQKEDGTVSSTRFFRVFNNKNGDVYEPINRNDIQLISYVSDNVLLDYLVSVSINYFEINDSKDNFIESSIIHNYDLSNVVDFFEYKNKKRGNR